MTAYLLLLLALALVLLCGLFVAAEFALVTVDRSTVDAEAAAGDGRGQVQRFQSGSIYWTATTGAGGSRYGMLEPVRQYARERLEESGEAAPARERHPR